MTETIWSDGTTFDMDYPPGTQADVVRIRPGAVIFFKNGITFNLRCNKLIIEGRVFFDGRGVRGSDASQPAPRPNKTGSGGLGDHDFVHSVFLKWLRQGYQDTWGHNAPRGGMGGQGARILISAAAYEGALFNPGNSVNVGGGEGGNGAAGGRGAHVACGICSHDGQCPDGQASGQGERGPTGFFALTIDKNRDGQAEQYIVVGEPAT